MFEGGCFCYSFINGVFPVFRFLGRFTGNKARFKSQRGQPKVCVILAQQQAEFCPAGEHAVRFIGSLGNEVIYHDADVSLITAQHQRRFAQGFQGGVRSRHQTLRRGFFIAGCAVDLTCKIQVFHQFCFQCGMQLRRRTEVIFHRISRTDQLRVFQTGNGMNEIALSRVGQGSGNSVKVEFLRTAAFRFQEYLMVRFFRKAHDFIFYGGTIPGAYAFNDTAVKRAEF